MDGHRPTRRPARNHADHVRDLSVAEASAPRAMSYSIGIANIAATYR